MRELNAKVTQLEKRNLCVPFISDFPLNKRRQI